jgi:hypothetical protein
MALKKIYKTSCKKMEKICYNNIAQYYCDYEDYKLYAIKKK